MKLLAGTLTIDMFGDKIDYGFFKGSHWVTSLNLRFKAMFKFHSFFWLPFLIALTPF